MQIEQKTTGFKCVPTNGDIGTGIFLKHYPLTSQMQLQQDLK